MLSCTQLFDVPLDPPLLSYQFSPHPILLVPKRGGVSSEAIAGGAVGGLLFVILLILVIVMCHKRWKERTEVPTYFYRITLSTKRHRDEFDF